MYSGETVPDCFTDNSMFLKGEETYLKFFERKDK